MTRLKTRHGDSIETSLYDVVNDIRNEEAVAKRAIYYSKHPTKDVIRPRTLSHNCGENRCGAGFAGHYLTITQGPTKWYPEHSAIGTTYHAICRLCGETDEWILGVSHKEDTGGAGNGRG